MGHKNTCEVMHGGGHCTCKPVKQNPDPWIARSHFDTLHARCADAEACLKSLLVLIDPDVLTRHNGDWKAATAEILQEEQ